MEERAVASAISREREHPSGLSVGVEVQRVVVDCYCDSVSQQPRKPKTECFGASRGSNPKKPKWNSDNGKCVVCNSWANPSGWMTLSAPN